MGNINFDASTVQPATPFEPLKDGWYAMRIMGAALKTSETAGEMLALEFEVDETRHSDLAGRRAWTNLCIQHPNDKPREIARQQLSAICRAIGKMQVSDTDDLLGGNLRVKVRAVPATEQYRAKNDVIGFQALDGSAGDTTVSAAPATAAPTPTATQPRPSWKK
jgi:hypothetical protein